MKMRYLKVNKLLTIYGEIIGEIIIGKINKWEYLVLII